MPTVNCFEDLEVWKDARRLASSIYKVTAEPSFAREYGLRDQMRRATVSIASNIAEGFERSGNRELARFLYVAKGSAGELRAQLYLAFDLGYITKVDFDLLISDVRNTSRKISAFIKYLERASAGPSTSPKSQRVVAAKPSNFRTFKH